MVEATLWPLALGVLGAVFGSFIATFAIRWPIGRSALVGRSECDGCRRTLRGHELVPIVSYLVQRGRCRSCGTAIAPSHLVIELLGLAIGLLAAMATPGLAGLAGAIFGWLLLALGAVDHAAFRLPNSLTAMLAIAALAFGAAGLDPPLLARAIGGIAGFASLWGAAALYRQLRGRDGLGGGDAKLFGAIGLWLGWRALAPVLLLACVAGIGWALAQRMRAHQQLPLGTLLAGGAFWWWLFMQMRG